MHSGTHSHCNLTQSACLTAKPWQLHTILLHVSQSCTFMSAAVFFKACMFHASVYGHQICRAILMIAKLLQM